MLWCRIEVSLRGRQSAAVRAVGEWVEQVDAWAMTADTAELRKRGAGLGKPSV
jgi:hypothetical protein